MIRDIQDQPLPKPRYRSGLVDQQQTGDPHGGEQDAVCEENGCEINGTSFKGIYVRNLGELNRALDDHPYGDYLVNQATVAHEHGRNSDNEYGLHWAGPVEHIRGASQRSAVDLLIAAQPIEDATKSSGVAGTR